MVKISGQFDVSLSIPIDVTPDFSVSSNEPCRFNIQESMITILPLKMTEAIPYPDGEYAPPELTELRVWINRDIDLELEQEECLSLPRNEELVFEKTLVEACGHFISIVKNKTNQWDLDTRHPIHAYNYEYWLDDNRLKTASSLEPGAKRLPEYAKGRISIRPSDFQDEFSQGMWREVVVEAPRPVPVQTYDELLYDARTFRGRMRYDTSVLYAAIASELMLAKACGRLLRYAKQSEAKLRGLKTSQFIKLISRLEPDLRIEYSNVKKLVLLRNKIAHGQTVVVTHQQVNEAIGTAVQLKHDLAELI